MKKSIIALVLGLIKYLFVCLSPAAVRGGSLGYGDRNRYVVISWIWCVSNLSKKSIAIDRYTSDKIHWKAGGDIGYIIPINFDISIGAGDIYEKGYICMGSFPVPFAKVELEYMGFAPKGCSSRNVYMGCLGNTLIFDCYHIGFLKIQI